MEKVIGAFGARYDSNPDVACVVICGLGNHDEWNLAQDLNDSTALLANGGLARWLTQAEAIITSYANKFQTTPFMSALQFPFYGQDGIDALDTVSDWSGALQRRPQSRSGGYKLHLARRRPDTYAIIFTVVYANTYCGIRLDRAQVGRLGEP